MKKIRELDHGLCNIMEKKLKIAIHSVEFAQRVPVYKKNGKDKKISKHLLKAAKHIKSIRDSLQEKITFDIEASGQLPKDIE